MIKYILILVIIIKKDWSVAPIEHAAWANGELGKCTKCKQLKEE